MATKYVVDGDQYRTIDKKMREIKRQLDQSDGSPLDPLAVMVALQRIVEGEMDFSLAGGVAQVTHYIPEMAALKRRFPFGVDPDFDPGFRGVTFRPIEACKNAPHETYQAEFRYVYLCRGASSEMALVEIVKCGLRPATVEELLAFDSAHPGEMMKFPIVALGSTTTGTGRTRVACLITDGRQRELAMERLSTVWSSSCRFLCVRKEL